MLQTRTPGKRQVLVLQPEVSPRVGVVSAACVTARLVFVAKAQKIEMDKLEKAKKERTKVSDGRQS